MSNTKQPTPLGGVIFADTADENETEKIREILKQAEII